MTTATNFESNPKMAINPDNLLSLDPWSGSEGGFLSGRAGAFMKPTAPSDPLERALSFYKLHVVPAGVVLQRSEEPFGPAPAYCRSRPTLGDRRSAYVLVQGKVRFLFSKSISMMPLESTCAAPSSADAAQTQFKSNVYSLTPSINDLLGDRSKIDECVAFLGTDEGRASNSLAGVVMGSSIGCSDGDALDEIGNEYSFVDVNSIAAPVVINSLQLVNRTAAHPSSIVTRETSVLLELRPSAFVKLCRQLPGSAAGFALLASPLVSNPHLFVDAIPCLRATFADAGVSSALPLSDQHALISCIGQLSRHVVLSPGEAVFDVGDWGDCCYVVVSGQVAVSCPVYGSAGASVSSSASSLPSVLLSMIHPGGCLGESGLFFPSPRSTRAVAMCSTILLRITNASLRSLMHSKPKVWRSVRANVQPRVHGELVRLPFFSSLVGGEKKSEFLSPLTDLFTPFVLRSGDPSVLLESARLPCNSSVQMSLSRSVNSITPELCNADSLFLVVSGKVAANHENPNEKPRIYEEGEYLNATTLYRPKASFVHISSIAPVSEDAQAIVLALPKTHLDVFVTTIPGGTEQLREWRRTSPVAGALESSASYATPTKAKASMKSVNG
jgi:CRP-like cAMP-binding protein